MGAHAILRLGISGAVPEPEVLAHKASSSDIHLTVRRIAERALADGHVIVYGSHPTFTPIIEDVALQQGLGPDQDRRVQMFVAKRYFTPEEWEAYHERHARYAEVEPIGDFDTAADQALRELRDRMVGEINSLICIGGKLHRDDKGNKPGVEEEYERALRREPPIPIYLLGGPGGCTREIYERHDPPKTSNGLDDEDNRRLGESAQAWDAVELVFKGVNKLRAGT